MPAVHFVVEQADGREAPLCHPEGLPGEPRREMWTRAPRRVTCAECLAILTGMHGRAEDGFPGAT